MKHSEIGASTQMNKFLTSLLRRIMRDKSAAKESNHKCFGHKKIRDALDKKKMKIINCSSGR